MGNPFASGSSGSAPTNQGGSGLAGLSDTFANLFASNAALDPTTGTSGLDVAGMFGNLDPTTFNEDTASLQATQAITPPAQAQANAATGQDPSAGIGGTRTGTQTASTGPSNQPNQPSQEQQDQEQRNRAIDELRRQLRQRQKQQQEPPQWNPRYAAATAQTSGATPPPLPPSGAPYPEGTDYQTEYGHELNLPKPGPTALPDPSGTTSSGQVVPVGEEGRQITVQPRAPLPPRTVPGTPSAPPPTPDITFKPGEPIPTGGGGIPGLPGLGALPWFLEGAGIGLGAVPLSATPAETGEFTPAEPNFVRPDAPVGTRGLPGPADPPPAAPPPAPVAKRKEQPKPKPKAADPPRRVWVPPTPGHYAPTTGLGRGPGTWVPGTPGHYAEVRGASPAAVSPDTGGGQRKSPEAARRLSEARAEAPEVMAYNQDARMPTLLRDIAGLGFLPGLAAYANEARQLPRNTPSNVYGQGGTRPYNENWGGRAYVAKGDEVQRGRQYMGYLTGKGLTRQGAAALLGNAHQESNLSATLAPGGDGGTAAGMFQWRGPRQVAFRRWLQANGRSESDPQAHLDFALYEMQTNPAYRASWEALHNPNMSPAQIADVIANNYEVSKRGPSQGMNNRIGFANSMLQGGGQGPIQASGGGLRVTDPNQNPLTSHTYPAPGETSGQPIQARGGDAQG